MTNYYLLSNIRIKKIANYDKLIKSYTLNKEDKNVKIFYMNGGEITVPVEEVDIKELEQVQTEQLKEMQKRIYPKLNRNMALTSGFLTISGVGIIGNLLIGNPLASLGCLLSTTSFLMNTKSFSLKREMKLISWINEHKEEVNDVIREEVDSLVDDKDRNESALNQTIQTYPDTKYPEEIYYDGINLGNMTSLGLKELRKIKRKVKKKERNQ